MPARHEPWGAAVRWSAGFVALLVAVHGLRVLLPGLTTLGVLPRTVPGLAGIVFAPLLHADLAHLLANALPLFVLLVLLFADRGYQPARSLALIWLLAGAGTWLIGRGQVRHLGASSLIYGLITCLLAAGWFRRSGRAVFVAVLVLLLYDGFWYGVLPRHPGVSWEAHLSGAVAGICAGWRLKR